MYTFKFIYTDKTYQSYNNIVKVEYSTYHMPVTLTGEEVFSHDYPLSYDLHLFSENKNYKVSHEGLKSIEVEKEKS